MDWDIDDLVACSANSCLGGKTTYTIYDSFVNIQINSQMISSASKLFIANTMLHELIHAEVIRLLVSEGDDNFIPDGESNFPSW
ncbi:hypothetical protein [Flavobacterium sp.]|uniref:hypothetical protein n=1 Tax=Flavobacterium sp. TaxID=239 RepID=UPI00261AB719|nr:hypothetical protein [Flavobacterium sp.]